MKPLDDRMLQPVATGTGSMTQDSASRAIPIIMSRTLLLAAATMAAVGLWLVSLPAIRLEDTSDLGLISVLPPTFFLALGILMAGSMLALRLRPLPRLLLFADTVVLILMLYATLPIVASELSFSTAWLHTGFAETIARTGDLFHSRDARFSWPAFFALTGYLSQIGGLVHPIEIAHWSPVILNLLYLGPLLVIFRSATLDARLIWLAVWVFYAVNWVGQDYFSPQGFAFLLYLSFFAILLSAFRVPGGRLGWLEWLQHRLGAIRNDERGGLPDSEGAQAAHDYGPRARAGLVVIAVVLFTAVTAGHQLTPFAAVGAVIGLVLFRRTTLRGLPLVMLVVLSTWLSYMTVTFLAGHLAGLLEDLGRTENVAASNVANRIRGSFEHQLVVYARLGFASLVWFLAFVGGVRRLFDRQIELTMGLLALAPFGLIGLQGYGGEMLLRVFLFSSPFMAYLAAAALAPYGTGRTMSMLRTGAVVIVLMALLSGFLLTRYGNTSADYMTSAEVVAADRMYDIAADGSVVATMNHNAPLQHRRWEQFRYQTLREEIRTGDVDDVVTELERADAAEAYLFLNRSQGAFARLFQGMTEATWDTIVASMRNAPELEVVYENEDAVVLRLRAEGTALP